MRASMSWVFVALTACTEFNVAAFDPPPVASIVLPPSGSAYDESAAITFVGQVADDATADQLTVQWRSDIDEVLSTDSRPDGTGRVEFTTANLSPGNHAITLIVFDPGAQSSSASITLTVRDLPDAPDIDIVHPAGGDSSFEGDLFEFIVQVSDAQDAPEDLVVTLESDIDGFVCTLESDAIGIASCEQALTAGDHHLTFEAEDLDGFVGRATTTFAVISLDERDDDHDGFTEAQGDCDDDNALVAPGRAEVPDRLDNDCDGTTDEGTIWYDDDGDGYCESTTDACSDGSALGDCNDAAIGISPAASEVCGDGLDNDCTGVQENLNAVGCTVYYRDYDRDSYGDATQSQCLCSATGDYTANRADDCDDNASGIHPGAPEAPDGLDNDCDVARDEGTQLYDDDGDGYCDAVGQPCTLQQGQAVAWQNGDCNDFLAAVHPGATEVCGDGLDNNCANGETEENASGCQTWYRDFDGDGYGTASAWKCLCQSSGDYDVQNTSDCYDGNPAVTSTAATAVNAHPGQTQYFTVNRGDGSFDYDCNNTIEKEIPSTIYDCDVDLDWDLCSSNQGWNGGAPGCGNSQTWYTDCEFVLEFIFPDCDPAGGITRTQACR